MAAETPYPIVYAGPEQLASASPVRITIVSLLLVVGIQFSLLVGHAMWPPRSSVLLALAIIALIAAVPPIARRFSSLIEPARRPSLRSRLIIAALIAAIAIVALYGEAIKQHRTFSMKYQDEFSYTIQARMIAHGRLWMPPHPLADFFDSFQFIGKPIYGSVYFPGAAMLFAPGVWFGFPFWVMPLLLSAAATALLYLVITSLFDGVAGLLSAVMLISLPMFRLTSLMALAQAPTLFLSFAMLASWLGWRSASHSKRKHWLLALGVISGWCAITRPVDAMITAIPIGIAIVIELVRQSSRPRDVVRPVAISIALIAFGALPLFAIQVVFNYRVTGSLTRTPFSYFADLCYPQTGYGFHPFDPSIRPASTLPQKQRFYDEHTVPFLQDHTLFKTLRIWKESRGPTTLINGAPHVLMFALMPVGLIGVFRRQRWVIAALLPLFVIFYIPYVFFLTHYTVICAAGVIAMVLIGAREIESTFAFRRASITIFFTLSIAMLSISEMSIFNRSAWDEFFTAPELQHIDRALEPLGENGQRAVVLFRFAANGTGHIEPVYNADVIWPDDAPVIRAHDLGVRNIELFSYYAKTQPDRVAYLFDRADGSLLMLGRVDALAKGR